MKEYNESELISIIVPFGKPTKYLNECIEYCKNLDYENIEIILLPDDKLDINDPKIKIFPTGKKLPAEKRNIGVNRSKGSIIAFIDDDVYPSKNWLNNIIEYFNKNSEVGAICGPAVTPQNDGWMQKISGAVYSSIFVSGNFLYRYLPKNMRFTDDFPSCNFIMKKSVLEAIGGFSTNYWPGEDTILCLDILKANKKILYAPDVLVYHHRRKVYKPHMDQISSYALHRGFFVKKFGKNSIKLGYFVPSMLLLFIVFGGILSLFNIIFSLFYILLLSLYFFGTLGSSIYTGKINFIFVFIGIVLTNIFYGYYFLKGLFLKKLEEE